MNPYFQLMSDLVALMESPQFAAVMADIRSIEGGSGNSITSPGAGAAIRRAIAAAAAEPDPTNPAIVRRTLGAQIMPPGVNRPIADQATTDMPPPPRARGNRGIS